MTLAYVRMKTKRYFQSVLFLPLALPLVALLVNWLATGFPLAAGNVAGPVVGLLFASLLVGGVPYLVFLTGALLWTRNRDTRMLQLFTLVAPFVYFSVFAVCFLGYVAIESMREGVFSLSGSLPSLGYFALFIFGFGYAYVLIANAGYEALKRTGVVELHAESAS